VGFMLKRGLGLEGLSGGVKLDRLAVVSRGVKK
jgi:hypothetical protein